MVPKLAAKARLRWDKREQKYLLIYPERGILLNESAGAILSRCDGVRTIDAIIDELAARAKPANEAANGADPAQIRARIHGDVQTFLEEMRKRGVLEIVE